MKKKRMIAIAAVITAVCVTSGAVAYRSRVQAQAAQDEQKEQAETVTVSCTDIEKTISLTGTLVSASEENANTGVTDMPVKEVKVNIGDSVKKGDILYTLDTSDVQRSLDAALKSLSVTEAQNRLNQNDAVRQLNDAQITGALQATDAIRSVSNANADLSKANAVLSDACSQVSQAKNDENSRNDAKNAAASKAQSALDALNSAKAGLKGSEDDEEMTAKVTELENAYSSAKADFDTASAAYDAAVSARAAKEEAVKSARDGITSAQRAYDAANASKMTAANTITNSIASQQKNVESTKLTNSNSTADIMNNIEKYKKQLAGSVVSANISGVVTAVNVKKGIAYTGSEGVTVDNMDSFNVSTDVDEANVADIATGMRVNIKTDSTGDEVLTGKVTFISPTPTKAAASTGNTTNAGSNGNTAAASDTGKTDKSRGTYKTLISIEGNNTRLRLGMTAKLTVILDSAKNVTAVPIAAISSDAAGKETVQVTSDGGVTSRSSVITTGLENDYYAEVKSGLKKGDIVVMPSEDQSGSGSSDDGLGALGGIM